VSLPRALVVRSGANPFASFAGSSRIEILERSSHSIEPVETDRALLESRADFAIFTSQVAVESLFADESGASLFRTATAGGIVVAVGPVTGEALRAKSVVVGFVAAGSGESVLERLPEDLSGRRVLLPCGEDASPELPERLHSRGAHVDRLVLYRKVARPRDRGLEREILERPFAAFCTTSPSAARWLFAGLGEAATRRLQSTPAVVLGRFTRRFLESHGVSRIEVTEEARFAEAVAVLEALATAPAAT
jgi:uroporphyrinogen III methyltransferase / synthase